MYALIAIFSALGGSALLLLGERILGPGADSRFVFSGIGAALLVAALALRAASAVRARGPARKMLALPVAAYASMTLALLLYFLTVEGAPVGPTGDLSTVLSVLWPIAWLSGAIPAVQMEWLLRGMEGAGQIEDRRVRSLGTGGLTIALAASWIFVMNYVATDQDTSWNARAVRDVAPSGLTRSAVKSLTEQVTATLFFPPANEVAETVSPYFEELARENPLFVLERTDTEQNPTRAKELKARKNATIVLHKGDSRHQIVLDLDQNRARRKLKKLDEDVRSKLALLTVTDRVVYVVKGHGERETMPPNDEVSGLRDLRRILQKMGYSVKTITTTDGLTTAIPKDATFVLLPAPASPLLPREVETLRTYVTGGGSLMVLLDPEAENDPEIDDLLTTVGVASDRQALAHDTTHVQLTGGKTDRANVVSNRFTSHDSTAVLSKVSGRGILWFSGATSLNKSKGAHDAKVTFTVKAWSGTYKDTNGNLQHDKAEPKRIFNLVAAAELPPVTEEERGGRALVVADADVVSDRLLKFNLLNQQFLVDSVHWLEGNVRPEAFVPDLEDTPIIHTRAENQAWFWGMIVGLPMFVLVFGLTVRRFLRREWGGP
jgi:hypothetical protein